MMVKEKERLFKFDSLTVLDYIKTSIEILMSMKLDEDKFSPDETNNQRKKNNPSSIY